MDVNLMYHLIHIDAVQASHQGYGYEKKMLLGISVDTLQALTDRYLWGKRLAAQVGLPERAAAKSLIRQGIKPLCGPTIDGSVGYVFWRSDILDSLASELL